MQTARWTCYILSGMLMLVALSLILWLDDTFIGIFAALIAAVLARVLSINVAGQFEPSRTGASPPEAGSNGST